MLARLFLPLCVVQVLKPLWPQPVTYKENVRGFENRIVTLKPRIDLDKKFVVHARSAFIHPIMADLLYKDSRVRWGT